MTRSGTIARPVRIAVLDDYQGVALEMADWSVLAPDAEVSVFRDPASAVDALARRLDGFDIISIMRERTRFGRELLERLPKLRLLVTTGQRNAAIDVAAAAELGITVCGTEGSGRATAELTWGLILALARHIPSEDRTLRSGAGQSTIGVDLAGRTLGVIGLGRLGARMAAIGRAFDMKVLAWSANLTAERAARAGADFVAKDTLLAEADFVTLHLVLSERTRGVIDAEAFELMKPTAWLINTARGPIVDEAALIGALQRRAIAGAGLDVFEREQLPADHPLCGLDNVILTPHLGYVTQDTYRSFYGQIVEDIRAFLDGQPVRVIGA